MNSTDVTGEQVEKIRRSLFPLANCLNRLARQVEQTSFARTFAGKLREPGK
jgi:hypothetical protein